MESGESSPEFSSYRVVRHAFNPRELRIACLHSGSWTPTRQLVTDSSALFYRASGNFNMRARQVLEGVGKKMKTASKATSQNVIGPQRDL